MLSVLATVENARKVIRLGTKHSLSIDQSIYEIFKTIPRVKTIPGFAFELKDFQSEGVAWLESQLGSGLLTDEQGTGKTVQVMAFAHKNSMFPMTVVCPNTMKLIWRNEILAMTGAQYRINVVGKQYSKKQTEKRLLRNPNVTYSKTPVPGHDIYVVSYNVLANHVESFISLNMKFVAVDESQKIKNSLAIRSKALIYLTTGEKSLKTNKYLTEKVHSGVDSVVLMSGTPLLNRPKELWTSLQIVGKWVPEFSTWKKFGFRYCGASNQGYGWGFNGSTNASELHDLLTKHVMLRRLKADVLPDLPQKIYKTIPLDFDRKEYDSVEQGFNGIDWKKGVETIIRLGGNAPKSDDAIVAIQKLREIASYAKINSAVEWIKDYTEDGEKLIVFAHNVNAINQIVALLKDDPAYSNNSVRVIAGGVSEDQRADNVLEFQNDPSVKVIVIGLTTGGAGLTLTSAKAVAFFQLPWTPGEISQATDRIHRIGQTSSEVYVYNLIAEGTIEEDIAELLIQKGEIMDNVLDNGRIVNKLEQLRR